MAGATEQSFAFRAEDQCVVTTTERTFAIRDNNGKAEWVNVSKGAADGDYIEVSGSLHAGGIRWFGALPTRSATARR